MINLKSKNIFLYSKKNYRSSTTLDEYLKLLELDGFNFVYMQNKRTQTSGYGNFKKIHYSNDTLLKVISENSFRLDFLLIEPDSINWTLDLLKDIKIPIVYIKKTESPQKYSSWDLAYSFTADDTYHVTNILSSATPTSKMNNKSDLYMTDLNTGDKISIDDVIIRTKRNNILSDIINPK